MKLSKIRYDDLNARQKEVFNFQKVAGFLADYGFNCLKLNDDWQGADFLAYHINGIDTMKVQLKSRPSIAKKYMTRILYIAFSLKEIAIPSTVHWYLIEHDVLVQKIGQFTNWLKTSSWINGHGYSADGVNKTLRDELSEFCISKDENAFMIGQATVL